MREITIHEMALVSGAASYGEVVDIGSKLGGAVGAATGPGIATGEAIAVTVARAGIGAVAGGGLATAGWLGWQIGGWINENTPIQSWISSGIDRLTRDGNDYCRDGGNY
ncbi:hypothetical protein L291_3990 [Acinetobacter guillouiae MSP4-18]|uniref:hypothetical protein n=1 Tax=Acinetobacter guillouiae TaxID=106649 RepID=UPI0002CECD16|nr:hypothetical protein [Acinetobacter guillouiae]ENU58541.1 hypothetical protein F981_02834 [Acinetobacter guillouiae CIP 63.46]EPH37786.1 hypothetical protein L291_3990 [Acinetobacter guillouiae MSP4-18]KAB0625957.1 hypothetical protein F7P82_13270 [Acinetobacter guillouiae]